MILQPNKVLLRPIEKEEVIFRDNVHLDGEVIAVGENAEFNVGDRVIYNKEHGTDITYNNERLFYMDCSDVLYVY